MRGPCQHQEGISAPPIDREVLFALARQHGLASRRTVHQPWKGATSRVYPWGDMVIKIPYDTPAAIAAARMDAAIGPVVQACGVKTPDVIAFDDSLSLLPVPFAIIRRVRQSSTLQDRSLRDVSLQEAWKAVGREVALVHQVRHGSSLPVQLREFRQSPGVDPRPWVDALVERGVLGAGDASWLHGVLDAVASHSLAEVPLTLCHGDINASNVLVSVRSGRFRSLIDWAGAGWLDPVWDFAGISLDVVPSMLAGHREVAPLPQDHTAEARIFWCQAQTRLSAAQDDASDEGARDQLVRHLAHLRRFVEHTGLP